MSKKRSEEREALDACWELLDNGGSDTAVSLLERAFALMTSEQLIQFKNSIPIVKDDEFMDD